MTKAEKDLRELAKKSNIEITGMYKGATIPIEFVASCGHLAKRTPQILKRALKKEAKITCEDCRYINNADSRKLKEKDVFIELKTNTFKCVSTLYMDIDSQMKFICDCGEPFQRSFYQARKSIEKHGRNICKTCMRKTYEPPNKLSVKKISNICKKHNAILLTREYSRNSDELEIIGECGHKFKRKWSRVSHSISLYGKILCQKCGMRQEQQIKKVSKGEAEVANFIKSLGFDVLLNKRPNWAEGKEIDIQVVGTNIAIEYNGEYWHSEEMGTGKRYHVDKEENARKAGVNLIQIFETEWMLKKDIVKSMLSSKLGLSKKIYARKCTIKKIDARTAKEFFNKTHRQGGGSVSNESYALIYMEEIVAVMSFRRPRFSKKYDMELYRYSSKLNYNVVGGFSKLLKHFNRNNSGTSIVTYADLRYSDLNSNVYSSCGFELEGVSPPNYFYFKQNLPLLNRVNYQKHKLKDKLDKFDPSKTEVENMRDNGFKRVWDCGSVIYVNKI